jgi:hypothetical protein
MASGSMKRVTKMVSPEVSLLYVSYIDIKH